MTSLYFAAKRGRGSWFGCQSYPIELTYQPEKQHAPFRKTWDRRLHIQTTHHPMRNLSCVLHGGATFEKDSHQDRAAFHFNHKQTLEHDISKSENMDNEWCNKSCSLFVMT